MTTSTLTPDLLYQMDAYWRAANYLVGRPVVSVRQPAAEAALTLADVKHTLS